MQLLTRNQTHATTTHACPRVFHSPTHLAKAYAKAYAKSYANTWSALSGNATAHTHCTVFAHDPAPHVISRFPTLLPTSPISTYPDAKTPYRLARSLDQRLT
jgi:hypothetical protein